jgi:protein phosphatase
VAAHPELSDLCGALIDLANERGGPDNITVVAARFDGDGLPEPTPSEGVGYAVYHLANDDEELTTTVPTAAAMAPPPPAPPPSLTGTRTRAVLLMAAVLCLLAALLLVWL